MAALQLAREEGLERYARELAVALPGADDELAEAIASAALGHHWSTSDPWSRLLIDWAAGRQGAAPPPVPPPITPPTARQSLTARVSAATGWFVDMCIAAGVLLAVGAHDHAFSGFPKGADAFGHVSKVAILARTWPHISWNPDWYAGMPHFESSYPPLFHFVAALCVRFGGMTPVSAVTTVVAAAVVLAVVSLYATVRVLSGSRVAGLVAACLFVATPDLWSQVVLLGSDARLFGLGMLGVGLCLTAVYLVHPSRVTLVAAVLGLAAAFISHFLTLVIGVAASGLMLLAPAAPTVRARLLRAAGVGLPAGGLAAFFYVPYLVLPKPLTTAATGTKPAALRTLFVPTGRHFLDALPLALVPLLAFSLVGCVPVLYRRWSSQQSGLRKVVRDAWFDPRSAQRADDNRRAAPGRGTVAPSMDAVLISAGAGIAGLGCVAFAIGGHFGLHVAVYGINTFDLYVFAAWLLAVPAATMTAVVAGNRISRRALVYVPVVAATVATVAFTLRQLDPAFVTNDGANTTRQGLHAIFPAAAATETQYRIGGTTDLGQDWVNAFYPTPEVRGYQNQGTVNLNWQFFAERALWDPQLTRAQRNFTLDWYGVKWVYADDPSKGTIAALKKDTQSFRRLANSPEGVTAALFQYRRATPIASATVAPTVLVIGGDAEYTQFFLALQPADVGSELLIPVHGKPYVDDYRVADLRHFDAVVLYGASAHSWSDAGRILGEYVKGGGTLTIEAADASKRAPERAPDVFPVQRGTLSALEGSFGFRAGHSPITKGVKLASFSPALYNHSLPWDIEQPVKVAPWASPVVYAQNIPIIVGGAYGNGHVYWSGMNLPYHASSNENPVESHFLAELVTNGHVAALPQPSPQAKSVGSEREVIAVTPGARGVLFKETAMSNWHARANGRSLPVYRAGPEFMWVPVPPGSAAVTFTYQASKVDLLGLLITAVTVALLVGYAAGLAPPRRVRVRLAELRHGVRYGSPPGPSTLADGVRPPGYQQANSSSSVASRIDRPHVRLHSANQAREERA
jgi:hypothetical protein